MGVPMMRCRHRAGNAGVQCQQMRAAMMACRWRQMGCSNDGVPMAADGGSNDGVPVVADGGSNDGVPVVADGGSNDGVPVAAAFQLGSLTFNRHSGPFNRHSGASRNLSCRKQRFTGQTTRKKQRHYDRWQIPAQRYRSAMQQRHQIRVGSRPAICARQTDTSPSIVAPQNANTAKRTPPGTAPD